MEPDFYLANDNHAASFSQSGRTKVGVGAPTGKIYPGASHLEDPIFLGKATFVHVNADQLTHLGETKVAVDFAKQVNKVAR